MHSDCANPNHNITNVKVPLKSRETGSRAAGQVLPGQSANLVLSFDTSQGSYQMKVEADVLITTSGRPSARVGSLNPFRPTPCMPYLCMPTACRRCPPPPLPPPPTPAWLLTEWLHPLHCSFSPPPHDGLPHGYTLHDCPLPDPPPAWLPPT